MKIDKAFAPVSITLETEEELKHFKDMLYEVLDSRFSIKRGLFLRDCNGTDSERMAEYLMKYIK